ncbi:MAG: HAD family hydrolase [Clostridiales bacterium]|nr:HAD family hydrolase [Clostridiales bacterium]
MVKAVIFDMDGTLLDSVPDILASINGMLTHFGFPTVERGAILKGIGQTGDKFVRGVLPEGEKDRVAECRPVYNEIYRNSGSPLTAMFPGVDEMLTALKSAGVKMGILSNKPHVNTLSIYEKKLGKFAFEGVLGNRENVPAKPDPTAVYELFELLGSDKENTVFVGDGEADMRTAKAAGIPAIAVSWGYRPTDVLKENGADYVVNTPVELFELLNRM